MQPFTDYQKLYVTLYVFAFPYFKRSALINSTVIFFSQTDKTKMTHIQDVTATIWTFWDSEGLNVISIDKTKRETILIHGYHINSISTSVTRDVTNYRESTSITTSNNTFTFIKCEWFQFTLKLQCKYHEHGRHVKLLGHPNGTQYLLWWVTSDF